MAGDVERIHSLKEAVYESLLAILSPSQDIIKSGEEQIKALEVTEGCMPFNFKFFYYR